MSEMLIHPEQERRRIPDWRHRLTHIGTGPVRWRHYLTVIFVLFAALYLGYVSGYHGTVATRPVILFLVGVAGLFILKYPFLGIVIVMASLPVVELIPRIPIFNTLSTVIGGATFFSYLLHTLVNKRGTQRYRVHISLVLAAVFIFWMFATHPAAALFGADRNWIFTFAQLLVIAWLTSHLIVKPHEHQIMMVVFTVMLVVSSVDLLQEANYGEIANNYRPDGLVGSANDAARHLVTGFLMLIYFNRAFRLRYLRVFLLGASVLYLIALIYTLSRTGLALLALAIGLLIVKGLIERHASANRLRQSIVAMVLVVVALYYTPPEVFQLLEQRFLPFVDPGQELFDLRGILWQIGLDVWLDYPIAGIGVGTFNEIGVSYAAERLHFNLPYLNAHNAYISLLAETGIVGFTLFCATLLTSLIALWRATRHPDPKIAEVAWTWFIILVVMMVGAMTKQEVYDKILWVTLGIGAGFGLRHQFSTEESTGPPEQTAVIMSPQVGSR